MYKSLSIDKYLRLKYIISNGSMFYLCKIEKKSYYLIIKQDKLKMPFTSQHQLWKDFLKMGCCSSINFSSKIITSIPPNTCYLSENSAAIKSLEIEEELNNLQKYLKYEIKLLLLGAAEVGKSTILKQVNSIEKE